MELLVNVDNPDEHAEWVDQAYATKGFVIPVFSYDLHELRGYNRLAGLARGDILLLVQDDRVAPKSCQFFHDLVTLFVQLPKLGGVGMNIARPGWVYPEKQLLRATFKHDFIFQSGGIPFQFVTMADFGPFAFRRSFFHEVGGLDEGMSDAGQCAHFLDFDLSMRLWVSGYQTGLLYMPPMHEFRGDGNIGGTHRGNKQFAQCWVKNLVLTESYFNRRFTTDAVRYVEKKVNASNHELLTPFHPTNVSDIV